MFEIYHEVWAPWIALCFTQKNSIESGRHDSLLEKSFFLSSGGLDLFRCSLILHLINHPLLPSPSSPVGAVKLTGLQRGMRASSALILWGPETAPIPPRISSQLPGMQEPIPLIDFKLSCGHRPPTCVLSLIGTNPSHPPSGNRNWVIGSLGKNKERDHRERRMN